MGDMADSADQLLPRQQPPPPLLSEQERPLGAFAYERVLSEAECRKVHRVQRRLDGALDGTIYVWVRDARPFAHGKESAIEPLQLRLHASLPVAEVRDRVHAHYEATSSYREHVDGPLQLFFDGQALEDGKLLAEYVGHEDKRKPHRKWPTPFAGILWVVPFRPVTRLAPHMWSG